MLPWLICAVLAILCIVQCVKIILLKRSMDEIITELREHLHEETNSLISCSSCDTNVMRMAAELNIQLKALRAERHRFRQGDAELKNAVSNISHDLRTPLTAICGYLDLIEREPKSPQLARYLEIIRGRTEALRQLTEQLLKYSLTASAQEALALEQVCVNAVLEESVAAFHGSLIERGIVPRIELCEARIVRELNREALSRVFGNVLSNALKYSDGDLAIRLTESGEVSFSNTAAALNGVQVAQMFDRFYTVETARGATGLGLAIARLLTERMGGEISAEYSAGSLKILIFFPEK